MSKRDPGMMVPNYDDTDTDTATVASKQGFKPADAEFSGSFAAATRPSTKRVTPWYKDRQYFLGGWTDISIWKSAVRATTPFSHNSTVHHTRETFEN